MNSTLTSLHWYCPLWVFGSWLSSIFGLKAKCIHLTQCIILIHFHTYSQKIKKTKYCKLQIFHKRTLKSTSALVNRYIIFKKKIIELMTLFNYFISLSKLFHKYTLHLIKVGNCRFKVSFQGEKKTEKIIGVKFSRNVLYSEVQCSLQQLVVNASVRTNPKYCGAFFFFVFGSHNIPSLRS